MGSDLQCVLPHLHPGHGSVSYTHLDVYKRQVLGADIVTLPIERRRVVNGKENLQDFPEAALRLSLIHI